MSKFSVIYILSIKIIYRNDLTFATNTSIRFPDDIHDRIWSPLNTELWYVLSTSIKVDANGDNGYQPGSKVMRTAVTTINGSDALGFNWESEDPTSQYYIYMHFAEIQELQANESREFNIYLNNNLWFGPSVPDYLSTTTIYSTSATMESKFEVWINSTKNSTRPPLINALEIYTVIYLQDLESNPQDSMFLLLSTHYFDLPG